MIISALWQHLFDDAAIFPPGNAPLPQAVVDHERRRGSDHADLVGPLVLSAAVLPELDPLLEGQPEGSLAATVTVPSVDDVAVVLDQLVTRPVINLRMLEVAIGEYDPVEAVAAIRAGLGDAPTPVAVEVPRDERRPATLDALGERAVIDGWLAKFRTGGITADLYPSAVELAEAVAACVARDLPFKCTAGLHHAIRHVDPGTGFDEHGFGNLLLTTHHALLGARPDELAAVLDERDGGVVAAALQGLDTDQVVRLRAQFHSFGTCSIDEPLTDLATLGLLDPPGRLGRAAPVSPDDLLHPDDPMHPVDLDTRRAP